MFPDVEASTIMGFDEMLAEIPDDVMKWAGLKTRIGTLNGPLIALVWLNDNKKLSFKEIADVIEQNWETL